MSKPQRRTCLGIHWRHEWEKIGARQKCRRCSKLNPLGIAWQVRFWDFVNKDGPIVNPELGKCWTWTGCLNLDGYGYYTVNRNRKQQNRSALAHLFAMELVGTPRPDGLQADHLCRNRACVNPTHLEPVTAQENLRRSPLTNAGRIICKRGHAFDEANTIHVGGKYPCRRCRTCKRAYASIYREHGKVLD